MKKGNLVIFSILLVPVSWEGVRVIVAASDRASGKLLQTLSFGPF